jgi:hypothetical protein
MNKTRLRWMGVVLGIVAALLLVFGAFADIASFNLTSGPVDNDPNWEWTGTVSLTNTTTPHRFLCIGFPGASPAVADVACTGDILSAGVTNFTCSVPKSSFSSTPTGTQVSWQIFASSNAAGNCGGNTVLATSGGWYPTAVYLAGFGTSTFNGSFWFIALLALALLTGAVLIGRRRLAVQKA